MLRFSGAGVSDVGLVRPHNEDSAFVGPYVALVADGVGGAAAGEVASATTAYAASAAALGRFGQAPEAIVRDAVLAARASLRRGVVEEPARAGMATTLTMLVCDGRRVVLGHVGDSRAYLLHEGSLRQLSRDHTYVQQLVETGRLTAAAARTHPWRNVVLRSLDGSPGSSQRDGGVAGAAVEVDVVAVEAVPGDRLLLCSDGLSDLVDEDRIEQVLGLHEPLSAAAVLTQSALRAGGRDNITCVVLDVVDGPAVVGDGQLLGAVADPALVVDAAAVRLPA